MSGFDNAAVDLAFFGGTRIQSKFICCVYADLTRATAASIDDPKILSGTVRVAAPHSRSDRKVRALLRSM
jgi:hypothetical protein